MKKICLFLLIYLISLNYCLAKDKSLSPDDLFFIDYMKSHNKEFTLYFKGREKSVLTRGEEGNYINDFPRDLYIYNYTTKSSSPLISYEWFPHQAKYFLQEYDFPVFPDDFAYYLLKDDQTLIMVSAIKSINANFKFDISKKKLEVYPTNGKFDFIISSFSKNCGYYKFKENYKCNIYKPLISSNLIN
tara:strand:+ start:262 stop:825 length:564 start_codon:yes stop_codon:yes gene_type:complete